MSGIEWVEVRAPSIEEATAVALQELGLESADAADIEVLEQPAKGFLGMGAQDAVIRVKPKQEARSSHRQKRARRGGSGGRGDGNGGGRAGIRAEPAAKDQPKGDGGRSGGRQGRKPSGGGGGPASRPAATPRDDDDRSEMTPEEQAREIERFLRGLLDAFGLEGEVSSRIEEGAIYIDVLGEQTEALVGPKGATLQSTLELCRTIIQRRVQGGAKIRLDIAGYNERRREALRIYARRLGERVLTEGGEVMLEPMNAAERKVVHDTIAEMEGVRSFSEGEEPRRSVVVAAEETDGS